MKKIFKLIIITLLFLIMPVFKLNALSVEKEPIDIYLFYGDGCPHCAKEEEFLDELQKKYDYIEIHRYETWYNYKNSALVERVKNAFGETRNGVPFTVIGESTFAGYNDNIGYKIEQKIKDYDYKDQNVVKFVIENPDRFNDKNDKFEFTKNEEVKKENTEKNETKKEDNNVVVPVLGKIDGKSISLPLLSVVVGTVDGFNPCAMWVLLFLISMLLGMKDRKRMWLLGITFLVTSALVYLLFMVSWLNIAMSVSEIVIVRNIIAIVALAAGIINLIKFFRKKEDDGCDIVDDKKRKKMFDKIKKFTTEKSLILSLLGIITLAISVNFVELACSAGLPLLFTQVLAMNDLSNMQYMLYIGLYILFFLLDDLIIFFIAMKSLKLTGFSSKYSKYSHIIGGVIMVLIGILLLIKPELLMFGV
jgi:Cytochrome c biogenesis protein